MWDGVERRQTLTAYQGNDRRQRAIWVPEDLGVVPWASLKNHRVPTRTPQKSPRMAHWETIEDSANWE